jgi:Family of unknown function (DUF5677)
LKILKKLIKEADKVYIRVISCHFQKEEEKEFGITDAVVLGLLENLINHSKSIVILLENKHYSSLDTILRTVFENYVYLTFILKKDTDKRAKSYAYSTRLKEISLFNSLTEDSIEGNNMRKFISVSKNKLSSDLSDKMDQVYQNEIKNIYLNDIGMKRVEQKWYNLDNKTNNFKKLCSSLGLSEKYELIYSMLSSEIHAKDAIRNFLFEENKVGIVNKVKEFDLYSSLSGLYLLESVKLVYQYYGLKKELKNFNILVALNYRYK